MKRVTFVMPVHGRERLAACCLRQLARTCDGMADYGIEATAVVIGDKGRTLRLASTLGFGTVERDNRQLGRKFNDGFQLACDPAFNPHPADYAVPVGSDDWVDPAIFQVLPRRTEIGIFRQIAIVNERTTALWRLRVGYKGGCGIRIIPRRLLEKVGYRPCEEDKQRACDTSALDQMRHVWRRDLVTVELDVHPLQIVDWKTARANLNSYVMCRPYRQGREEDPFEALQGVFPDVALEEMREVRGVREAVFA